MLEIPQKFRMDYLIKANKLSLKAIDRLTRTLVKFHSSTRTNAMIKSYGLPNFLKKKIDENFQTFGKLNNEMAAFKLDIMHKIYKRLTSFVANNKTLFYKRITQGKIREIHGDLYLGNI
jgi:aminoglycoside phosphotransferase family enzyme